MNKNENKLIDKIIKNETFEKGIDYNEEDFLDIKNGLENLANRMSRKTPQQFISYENKNHQTLDVIKLYLEIDSSFLNSFVYEKDSTDNDIDKKIDRLKNIFKNSNHSDFDDVYKECIENNNSMSVDIFNKILPREENLEYKDRSKKRKF